MKLKKLARDVGRSKFNSNLRTLTGSLNFIVFCRGEQNQIKN